MSLEEAYGHASSHDNSGQRKSQDFSTPRLTKFNELPPVQYGQPDIDGAIRKHDVGQPMSRDEIEIARRGLNKLERDK